MNTRLAREHWPIEAHHQRRDVSSGEDASASRTASGPVNLAAIHATIIADVKDDGCLHIPKAGRPYRSR